MNDEAWTIQRLLDWTTQFFKDKKADSPRLDAEILLAHGLDCQRIDLYTRFAEIVPDDIRSTFRDLVKRHAAGEPVAYLVGHREFYSLSFTVNKNVLIPRPETEHLVIETLDRVNSKTGDGLQLCDVGTGSGIVAICLAKYLPKASITAIEYSPQALEVAIQNAKKLQVDSRIQFLEGNLLTQLPADVQFDAIVSNPPYISKSEMAEVPTSVKKFEPELALVGAGEDGGQTSRDLIDQSAPRLKSGGWMLIETSPMLAQKLHSYVDGTGQWSSTGIAHDSAGLERIVWGKKK